MTSGLVLLQCIDSCEVRSARWTPDEQTAAVDEKQMTVQMLKDGEMFVAFVTVKFGVRVWIAMMLGDLFPVHALIAACEAVVFCFLVQAPVPDQVSAVFDGRAAAFKATHEIVNASSIDFRWRWNHDRGLFLFFEHHFDLLLYFHFRLLLLE